MKKFVILYSVFNFYSSVDKYKIGMYTYAFNSDY